MTTETPVAPWYRQPWFWFLLIFPGASIIYCAVAITIAINTENSMVTDDWSKEGRGINMSIARDQKAADLGMEAQIDFQNRNVTVNLSTVEGPADFPYLILNLFHPTLRTKTALSSSSRSLRAGLPGNCTVTSMVAGTMTSEVPPMSGALRVKPGYLLKAALPSRPGSLPKVDAPGLLPLR